MLNIISVSEVDSTNKYALRFKNKPLFKEGLVIIADYQTDGKGQNGNNWQSEKGKNLLISIVVEPNILVKNQFDICKIASLSVIDFLSDLGIVSKIKWPNDILVNKNKIAGILIQNVISKNLVTHSVIGIGLNVNQKKFDLYSPKASSLNLEMNKIFCIQKIQYSLINCIKNRLVLYRSEHELEIDYSNALFQKDKISVFESELCKFNAIIRGVSSSGLLIVETDSKIKKFNLKENRMLF